MWFLFCNNIEISNSYGSTYAALSHTHTKSEIIDLEDLETTYAQKDHTHDITEINHTNPTWT